MVASQVIARAMSIADLQNSKFITYQDQQNSIFESYKDLYSQITVNDDDFFISTIFFNSNQATNPSPGEYLFPLPSDFYKIRTVEYQNGAYWLPMERFALGSRGSPAARPRYRFQGNNLWVIGWNYPGFTASYQLRVHYYPLPVQPTFPDQPINFGSSISASNQTAITNPTYANILSYNGNAMINNRNYFYVQGTTNIWVESIDSGTSANLYTAGGAITNLTYYKGSLYFLVGTNLFSAPFSPGNTTITPVAVTITGSPAISSFTILGNTIYYNTAIQTFSVGLTGGTATSLGIGSVTFYSKISNYTYPVWISGGILFINSVSTGYSCVAAYTDNNQTIWTLTSSGLIQSLVVNMTTPSAPTFVTTTLTTDVLLIGPYAQATNSTIGNIISPFSPMIPIVGNETIRFQAISAVLDTDFSYPLNSNEAGEIMAYQCAIDFRTKQDQDITAHTQRKQELIVRMFENMRRDDYKMERVSNVYGTRSGMMGEGIW